MGTFGAERSGTFRILVINAIETRAVIKYSLQLLRANASCSHFCPYCHSHRSTLYRQSTLSALLTVSSTAESIEVDISAIEIVLSEHCYSILRLPSPYPPALGQALLAIERLSLRNYDLLSPCATVHGRGTMESAF